MALYDSHVNARYLPGETWILAKANYKAEGSLLRLQCWGGTAMVRKAPAEVEINSEA